MVAPSLQKIIYFWCYFKKECFSFVRYFHEVKDEMFRFIFDLTKNIWTIIHNFQKNDRGWNIDNCDTLSSLHLHNKSNYNIELMYIMAATLDAILIYQKRSMMPVWHHSDFDRMVGCVLRPIDKEVI